VSQPGPFLRQTPQREPFSSPEAGPPLPGVVKKGPAPNRTRWTVYIFHRWIQMVGTFFIRPSLRSPPAILRRPSPIPRAPPRSGGRSRRGRRCGGPPSSPSSTPGCAVSAAPSCAPPRGPGPSLLHRKDSCGDGAWCLLASHLHGNPLPRLDRSFSPTYQHPLGADTPMCRYTLIFLVQLGVLVSNKNYPPPRRSKRSSVPRTPRIYKPPTANLKHWTIKDDKHFFQQDNINK